MFNLNVIKNVMFAGIFIDCLNKSDISSDQNRTEKKLTQCKHLMALGRVISRKMVAIVFLGL